MVRRFDILEIARVEQEFSSRKCAFKRQVSRGEEINEEDYKACVIMDEILLLSEERCRLHDRIEKAMARIEEIEGDQETYDILKGKYDKEEEEENEI